MEYNKNTPVDTTLVSSLPKEIRDKGESLKELIDGVEIDFDAHKTETVADDVHGLLTDGKIIQEVGSNVNGRYIRFADGTQICYLNITMTKTINTQFGAIFRLNEDLQWVYPAEFLSNTTLSVNLSIAGGANNQLLLGQLVSSSATALTYSICSINSISNYGFRIYASVIGRWK